MTMLARLAPHVHWGLRLSLGATFLYHALGKYPVAKFATSIGMPVALAWAVAIVEVVAVVCLLAGAFGREALTRLAGAIVIVIMLGAIVMVHWANGFSVMQNGYEFQLLMLVTGVYFLVRGNDV